MNAFTAAHKTLPIPSYVRVTNTRNGKSVVVRINDRGPFHSNRIIDVSKAAAQQLGFVSQGTAHVKIEQIVPGKSSPTAENKDIFIDLKSFGTEREAQAYLNHAAQNLASSASNPNLSVEKRHYEYVVKMGPFSSQERAAEAEAQAIRKIAQAVEGSGANPAQYLIAVRYLETLKEMTSGQDNKTVYLPYEASGVLSSLGGIKELLK